MNCLPLSTLFDMKINYLIIAIVFFSAKLYGQDSIQNQHPSVTPAHNKLVLKIPFADFPQNNQLPYSFPSMNQAAELANDFYELSYWGIDGLGDKLFKPKTKTYTGFRKAMNSTFKYAVGLGFSKFGSELPIPLGVWAHEEFHRSVLGINGISSKNGNWLLNRWDGTVYHVSDSALYKLKIQNNSQLLYSYVAGVQFEVYQNQQVTIRDFYKKRSLYKNSLLLYNAYYVYNYFNFSTSRASDSVKVLAPPHESKNPMERDYAGADITAWAYDMFNPNVSYFSRDSFPNGEGVNRRIGFSDLSADAQSFLKKQKKLSLINFLNPSIFFVNRIQITSDFSFHLFAGYSPTHFGNDISIYLPVKYKHYDLLIQVHNYNNQTQQKYGAGIGLYNYALTKKLSADIGISAWEQPLSFSDTKSVTGGSIDFTANYQVFKNLQAYTTLSYKSEGWMIGNPYLKKNESIQLGIIYSLKAKTTGQNHL